MIDKILLWLLAICFFLLGGSGLILFFSFNEDVFIKVIGFNKAEWLSYHMILAIINVILISYHVGSRWTWIEKYILEFDKIKASPDIRKRQISNSAMILIFSVSLLSGFLSWIMSGECSICLEIHKYTGFFLWSALLYHIYLHKKSF